MSAPVITKMEVYPVAGKDCMELNLSEATPLISQEMWWFFTLTTARWGVGEDPEEQRSPTP